MIAFDTNILIYVHDSRDTRKQDIADKLVRETDEGVLFWQVIVEYLAASRKLSPLGFDLDSAASSIQQYHAFWSIIYPTWNVYLRAVDLMSRYSISIWDALIVAACLEAGIETLYSEDINDDYQKEGLRVVNPFKQQ